MGRSTTDFCIVASAKFSTFDGLGRLNCGWASLSPLNDYTIPPELWDTLNILSVLLCLAALGLHAAFWRQLPIGL